MRDNLNVHVIACRSRLIGSSTVAMSPMIFQSMWMYNFTKKRNNEKAAGISLHSFKSKPYGFSPVCVQRDTINYIFVNPRLCEESPIFQVIKACIKIEAKYFNHIICFSICVNLSKMGFVTFNLWWNTRYCTCDATWYEWDNCLLSRQGQPLNET